MKKRKLIAMALATMMAVSVIPAALPTVASADSIQPYSVPEVGSQVYVESVSAPAKVDLKTLSNNKEVTQPTEGKSFANWYNAAGVIFEIEPVQAGMWKKDVTAQEDPYFFFSVMAQAEGTVDTYGSDGKRADSYATFWTNDRFYEKKSRSDNPNVVDVSSTVYYSDDNGLTWKSTTGMNDNVCFGLNLADVKAGKVLIYLPMQEFFYYGGFTGDFASGIPDSTYGTYGVTASRKGYTTFGGGIQKLKDAEKSTELHSLTLVYRKAEDLNKGAQVAISATDLRLVYDVIAETKTVAGESSYDLEIYTREPAAITDGTVTATVGETTATLNGALQTDGRTKYVLTGIGEEQLGKTVFLDWSSATLGVSLSGGASLQKPQALGTLPSTLNINASDPENSPLNGASAIWAGDSLVYASRDKEADGWAGRIAANYSMTYANYAIGGRQIASFVATTASGDTTSARPIMTQLDEHILAQSEKERAAVDLVILDGGINDFNRGGFQMGEVGDARHGFDVRTYAGALEQTFATARRAYPNATVGFIILFQMPLASQGSKPAPCRDAAEMRLLVDTTIAACEKWGVHYLNMYDDQAFNDLIDTDNPSTNNMDKKDMLHLNKNGYILTAPYVAAWMETLPRQYVFYDRIIDAVSVSLTDGAEVSLYVNQPQEATDAKLTVSVSGGEAIELTGTAEDGRIRYGLSLMPWQMGEELAFTWSSETMKLTRTTKISVKQYCEYLIATSGDAALVDLAKALLHYGAATQKTAGYKTDALCNEGVAKPTARSFGSEETYENPDADIWKGAELILSPTPTLRIAIDAPDGSVTTVVYRVEGRIYGSGEYETASIENGTVSIPLAAYELGKVVNVRVYDGLGAWKQVYKTSGLLCLKNGADSELARALNDYAKYADDYVNADW